MSTPAPSPPVDIVFPSYGNLFPEQAPASSLIKSFSLFSFFRSSSRSSTPGPSSAPKISALQPILHIPSDPPPSPQDLVKALQSFEGYLKSYAAYEHYHRNYLIKAEDAHTAVRAFTRALELTPAVCWAAGSDHGVSSGKDEDTRKRLRTSLAVSLSGVFVHFTMARLGVSSGTDLPGWNDVPDMLLASIFPPVAIGPTAIPPPAAAQSSINALANIFERARAILTALQATLRPMAHSKVSARSSPVATLPVTDEDAMEIMTLLEIIAGQVDQVEELELGLEMAAFGKSAQAKGRGKTKAQKEEDKRRPMRIAMVARVLRADVALSMANRDIKAIKARAQRAQPKVKEEGDGEGEEGEEEEDKENSDEERSDPNDTVTDHEDAVKWEEVAENALVDILNRAKALMEDKRGGVLSDKVERSDWLIERSSESPADSPVKSARTGSQGASEDEYDSEYDSEEDESEDEGQVDTYPCPLRSIFALHDRYEEQRLAVWLSLSTATRLGMGTYMRGEGGRVGEAWDGLGLLLQLDYDSDTLGNFGLSVDKLDKWVELASRRNPKKIRRRSRKAA